MIIGLSTCGTSYLVLHQRYFLYFFDIGTALVVIYLILLALYYFAPSPAGC